MVLVSVGFGLAPLLVSGEWRWVAAWTYALLVTVGFFASRVMAARRNPGIIAERVRMTRHANVEPWDRVLAPFVVLTGVAPPVLAGLEARVEGVPEVTVWAILALPAMIAGYALGAYALVENPFFSGVVRIQAERGHYVVSTGPYRWVRHPGYLGALVVYAATPVLLGSWWAILPTAAVLGALVLRTSLEDATLQDALAGYRLYADDVRYRLVPRVW